MFLMDSGPHYYLTATFFQIVAEQLAEMSRRGVKFEYKEGDVYFSSVTNQFNITQ